MWKATSIRAIERSDLLDTLDRYVVSNVSKRGEYLPRIVARYKESERPFIFDRFGVSKIKGGGLPVPRNG